ncbi:MAG: RnfABCDGE type electron transport complex subunit B [Brachymonas sp.]|nr:RnfABCDGE type electron transport complex subunit B [Brachymonas sp.]
MNTPAADADSADLAQRIHRVLPQTQCRRCGQPDCAAYAQAIAQGQAPINQCPPGGQEGIIRIAQAIGQPERAQGLAIDSACGQEGPMTLAVIDENWCIGCTLCIKACPTDAILGGRKRMHTVLEAYCTGCELCVLACPVDCIAMEPLGQGWADEAVPTGWAAWSQQQADQALQRYSQRQLRLQTSQETRPAHAADQDASDAVGGADAPPGKAAQAAQAPGAAADVAGAASETVAMSEQERKRAIIEAALARARRGRQTQS